MVPERRDKMINIGKSCLDRGCDQINSSTQSIVVSFVHERPVRGRGGGVARALVVPEFCLEARHPPPTRRCSTAAEN